MNTYYDLTSFPETPVPQSECSQWIDMAAEYNLTYSAAPYKTQRAWMPVKTISLRPAYTMYNVKSLQFPVPESMGPSKVESAIVNVGDMTR